MTLPAGHFDHQRLHCNQHAVTVARWVRASRWPARTTHLRDQAVRASESMVLNLAEGAGSEGGSRSRHFALARGSAAEVAAVLDLVELFGAEEHRKLLYRVNGAVRALR